MQQLKTDDDKPNEMRNEKELEEKPQKQKQCHERQEEVEFIFE